MSVSVKSGTKADLKKLPGLESLNGNYAELSCNGSKLHIAVVQVTPEVAAKWLEMNTNNRRLRQTGSAQFGRDMAANDWPLTGESIKFGVDNKGKPVLLDGQHRLQGCVLSNSPFVTTVQFNMDSSLLARIDQGIKRTLADTLTWMGEGNAGKLASQIRVLEQYDRLRILDKGGRRSSSAAGTAITKASLLEWFAKNQKVRGYLTVPEDTAVKNLMSGSIANAAYYLFSKVDRKQADDFFTKLGTGLGLDAQHPIYLLRRRLEAEQSKKHRDLPTRYIAAIVVKAWNAYRAGQSVTNLRWAGNEEFPQISGL